MNKPGFLRRAIVRAAPTCTLWRRDPQLMFWEFVLFPAWKISLAEYVLCGGSILAAPYIP